MDINLIKKKLEAIEKQQQRKKTASVDYEKVFWTPTPGKHQIRVVPSKFNKKNPFIEAYFYYGIGPKIMISPLSFGEEDPIDKFVKKLKSTNDRENWQLARKIEAKIRVFAPVVIRGEEDKGVRWWQFGKNMYLEFLKMAEDDDIGDFTDVADGRDFTVDTVGPETTGTQYNKSSLRPKTKTTPLSADSKMVENFLKEQPDPLIGYIKYSAEEMKDNLQKWLEPDEQEESDDNLNNQEVEETPQKEVKVHNKPKFKPKKGALEEFEEIFSKKETSDDYDDDLPF